MEFGMEIGLPDGSTAKISSLPDFAIEATQKQMLSQIKKLVKDNDKARDALDKIVVHSDAATKSNNESIKAQRDAAKHISSEIGNGLKGFRTRFADRIEADTQQVFGFATAAMGKLATAAIASAGFLIGMGKAAIGFADQQSRALSQVTAAGAGFSDNMGGDVKTVVDSFRPFGMTLEQSTALLSEFSRATQTVGKYRLPQLANQFMGLTKGGAAFGLTMADATRAMMDELQQRSEYSDVSSMDSQTLSASVAKSVKLQYQYASALGISVDQLRKSVADQIKGNDYILAASLKFGPQFTQNMADFATVLKGSAGESIAPVSDAIMSLIAAPESQITEQGQAIRMFSAQLKGTGVDLDGVMNKYQRQVQATGTFDGQAAGQEILGVFRAAIGKGADLSQILSQAKAAGLNPEMINAITQSLVNLQTSANSTAKDLKPSAYQLAVNAMKNNVDAFKAILESAKEDIFGTMYGDIQQILSGLTSLIQPAAQAFSTILRALLGTGASGDIAKGLASLGPHIVAAGNMIAGFINSIRATFEESKDEAGNIDWGKFIGTLVSDAIWWSFDKAGDIIAAAAETLWENPKILGAILAGLGTLFAIAAAKSAAGAVVDGFKNKISDRISGRQPPGMPGGAGAPGAAPGGAPATLKSVGMDTLKGLGGAVQMLAKGAAGVAVMYLLAKALPAVAAGIKSFEGVTIDQLLAAGAAIAGMGVALFAASKIFTNPMTIAGLAVFTLGIMGLGKALEMAAPFVKEFAPIVQTLINAIKDTALGLMDTFVKTLERIPEIITAIGDGAKSVFEGAAGLVTSIGTQIQGIITSVASGISQVISTMRGAQDEAMLIKAQTDSVKELSNIQPGNISAVATAINQLAAALSSFGEASGGTWNEMIKGAMGGGQTNAIAAQIELLNQFGTLNKPALIAGASAITTLTASLNKFADIDINKIAGVNDSIYAMVRANDATIKSMERVAKLDGKVIAENARAIMIYNGAAQGEIIVPPTPAAGADLSSFYQAIVRALNGGTPVSQANLNPNRQSGSQPETLQQQMVRLLSTIESNTATANRKLDEVTKAVR